MRTRLLTTPLPRPRSLFLTETVASGAPSDDSLASELDEPCVETELVLAGRLGMLLQARHELVHVFDRINRHEQVVAVLDLDAE